MGKVFDMGRDKKLWGCPVRQRGGFTLQDSEGNVLGSANLTDIVVGDLSDYSNLLAPRVQVLPEATLQGILSKTKELCVSMDPEAIDQMIEEELGLFLKTVLDAEYLPQIPICFRSLSGEDEKLSLGHFVVLSKSYKPWSGNCLGCLISEKCLLTLLIEVDLAKCIILNENPREVILHEIAHYYLYSYLGFASWSHDPLFYRVFGLLSEKYLEEKTDATP